MSRGSTETKNRILKMARNLYSIHGSEGTTLDDILTASGITKGAFYHYFKNKQALCEAVLQQAIDEYHQLIESIDTGSEPIEQLRGILERLTQLNASGQWLNCKLILRLSAESHASQPTIRKKLNDFWKWYSTFYESLLEKCRVAGQLSTSPDTVAQAKLILFILSGSISLRKNLQAGTDLPDLPDNIIRAIQF